MALGQVNQWRTALDAFNATHIQVWGVGGVESGRDVHDMQTAGARIVQVGTAYFVGGAKVFSNIANQYVNP
jgi:dihydroorotate dehydrogenase